MKLEHEINLCSVIEPPKCGAERSDSSLPFNPLANWKTASGIHRYTKIGAQKNAANHFMWSRVNFSRVIYIVYYLLKPQTVWVVFFFFCFGFSVKIHKEYIMETLNY